MTLKTLLIPNGFLRQNVLMMISVFVLLSACSKDKQDDRLAAFKVSQIQFSGYGIEEPIELQFGYDTRDRINRVTFFVKEDSYMGKFSFVYDDDEIILYFSRGSEGSAIPFQLNEGRIISGYSNTKYKYNTNGFLSEISVDYGSWGSDKTVFEYQSNNLIKISTPNSVESIEFIYDKKPAAFLLSPPHFTLMDHYSIEQFIADAVLYEQGYFGKKSKDRLVETNIIDGGNPIARVTNLKHSYSQGQDGNISEVWTRFTTQGNINLINMTYNYDCN